MFKNSVFIKIFFLNRLIWRGNKLRSEKMFHELLYLLKKRSSSDPFLLFYYGLFVLRPVLTLRSYRHKRETIKAPASASPKQKESQAIRFLLLASKKEKECLKLVNLVNNFFLLYASLRNPAIERKVLLYKEALETRGNIKRLGQRIRS